MNDKVNKDKKIKDFKDFQVNSKIMNCAKKTIGAQAQNMKRLF